jgi:pimeloyl-ACP methyl ester carboxylesterase
MNESVADVFQRFVASSEPRRLTNAGVPFRYRAAGHGPQGGLLLPGAVGGGDAYFALAPHLETTHRLIAITYPPVDHLEPLLDGLLAIADAEGLESLDVVGGSFGGLVAQALLARAPSRVRRVVLSVTAPADPSRADKDLTWQRRLGKWPLPITRALLRLIVRATLRRAEERAFWREFYGRAIAETSKADVAARYGVSADLDRRGAPTAAELAGWNGRLLIVEGDRERIAGRKAREALKAVFPMARVCTIPGAGHAASAERPREWAAAVARFLTED